LLDALASVSLFGEGGRRLVIVEEADSFVSQFRSQLEGYVERPYQSGVLIVEVASWPGNTKLAKAVAAHGLAIECKSPKETQLKSWLNTRAKSEYDVRIETAAVEALLDLVPPELGILEQELSKLALLAGKEGVISVQLVRENVGGWRSRAVWDLVDAAADGNAKLALELLDRLIASGEKPQGLLPQMSSSLRRFTAAAALVEAAEKQRERLSLREALARSGVLPFKLIDAERQLRQIGRRRAKQLTSWLLAADLAMKGHNSSDERARIELERLIVRLSSAGAALAG
jgi:DNA polymerase-3 subunit delta